MIDEKNLWKLQPFDNTDEEGKNNLEIIENILTDKILNFENMPSRDYIDIIAIYCRYLITKYNLDNVKLYFDKDLGNSSSYAYSYSGKYSPDKDNCDIIGLGFYSINKDSLTELFYDMDAISHEIGHLYDHKHSITKNYKKITNENGIYRTYSANAKIYLKFVSEFVKSNKRLSSALEQLRYAKYFLNSDEVFARQFAREQTKDFFELLKNQSFLRASTNCDYFGNKLGDDSQKKDLNVIQHFQNCITNEEKKEAEKIAELTKCEKKYTKLFDKKINKVLNKFVSGKLDLDRVSLKRIALIFDLIDFDINIFYEKVKQKQNCEEILLTLINNPKLKFTEGIKKDLNEILVDSIKFVEDEQSLKNELEYDLDNFPEEFLDNVASHFEDYKIKLLQGEIKKREINIQDSYTYINQKFLKNNDETLEEFNKIRKDMGENMTETDIKDIETLKQEIEKLKKMKEEKERSKQVDKQGKKTKDKTLISDKGMNL